MKPLKTPTGKEDMMLMMEFRDTYWDLWTKFCKNHGFKPKTDEV
jgi:hypothetical protein